MKAILLALTVIFASCALDEDPKPQASCAELQAEIDKLNKEIAEHYAKGSEGNPTAWEKELTRLNQLKTPKAHEYAKRLCQ